MTRVCSSLAAIAAVLGAVPAGAAEILRTDSFTISGPPGFASTGFAGFDPALGTLDKVVVSLSGTLQINTTLAPLSAVAPVVGFDATGLGGKGFDFAASGAEILFPSLANPTQAPQPFVRSETFSLDFRFTALTDIAGFTVANASGPIVPPTSIDGRRDGFVSDFGVLEQLSFVTLNLTSGFISGDGNIFVTFDFTPNPRATAVPEPDSILISGLALAGLAIARRRRQGHTGPNNGGAQ